MKKLSPIWTRLVAFGFDLLYHQLAPFYDTVSWLASFGRWRSWQLAALPYVQGRSVLELAHGPGHMLLALQEAGFAVTGVDPSPQMGRIALRRLGRPDAGASVLRAPAQDLPLAARSFDTVLTTFPTEFIADQRSLREVHRVLRDGGCLLIIPQARLTGDSRLVTLLELAYRLTGQRNVPQENAAANSEHRYWLLMQRRLFEVGFESHIERIQQPGAEVILLIACKI